jgi:hypothetical protein
VFPRRSRLAIQRRHLRGPGLIQHRARLAHACGGGFEVGVVREGLSDQALEGGIAEERPPALDRQLVSVD